MVSFCPRLGRLRAGGSKARVLTALASSWCLLLMLLLLLLINQASEITSKSHDQDQENRFQ